MKRLALKHDKPSLWLAADNEAMEETATTHANGTWELSIINHLISCCNIGGLEQIDKEISAGAGSDFEESNLGYDKDEPAPVMKSNKRKRIGKQQEKRDAGNILLQCCNGMAS
jgi:hypothetical protein